MHWRSYLRIQTQNPVFLWRAVIAILVAGALIAYLVQNRFLLVDVGEDARFQSALVGGRSLAIEEAWLRLLADADEDEGFDVLLDAIVDAHQIAQSQKEMPARSLRAPTSINLPAMRTLLSESDLEAERKSIAESLWKSVEQRQLDRELVQMAGMLPQRRFANLAMGVYWNSAGQKALATYFFQVEGRLPEAKEARERVVNSLLANDELKQLKRLVNNPLYEDLVSPRIRLRFKTRDRDWSPVWWLIPQVLAEQFQWGPAALAAFAGLGWFLFAIHAGQVDSSHGARWWLCVAALPLGFLSIWVTLFLVYYQEVVWNLRESSDLVGGLRYFVAGVGFREELSKALMLAPLIPFLARRGKTLEVLIVGACVGLGFAVVENHNYFAGNLGTGAIGRFLTANFFHMASTSLIGLAIVRAVRNPRRFGPEAVAWFAVIVFAHGLYDAAIVLPALSEYSIASSIILVLLAFQFFRDLRDTRLTRPETMSLTATFLLCVSLLTAVTLIYVSSGLGFRFAVIAVGPEALSMALMVYVFLREMPNSLMRT